MDSLKQSLLRAQALSGQPSEPPPVPPAPAIHPAAMPAAGSAAAKMDDRLRALDRKLDALLKMLSDPGEPQCATDYLLIADVRRVVARFFAVSEQDIDRAGRSPKIARIRQIGYFLCRTHTSRSLPEIGKSFGGRDHATVLHGVRKIDALRRVEPGLHADLTKLEARLDALLQKRRAAINKEA